MTIRLYFLLIFFCASGFRITAFAIGESNKDTSQNLPNHKISYKIGFYAGVNNALTESTIKINPGPSYMIYGQFGLSKKCDIGFGLGAIFYSGKALNYSDATLDADTVVLKNYSITNVGYATVPVFFKYSISNKSKIVAGVRVSAVLFTDGSGTFSYYKPSKPDSVVLMSHYTPNFPMGVNNIDFGGLFGYEYGFSKFVKASVLFNINGRPIDPNNISDAIGPKKGNYNVSFELGIHYILPSHTR